MRFPFRNRIICRRTAKVLLRFTPFCPGRLPCRIQNSAGNLPELWYTDFIGICRHLPDTQDGKGETAYMSQEKVDRYKEQKKNRKAIQARKKRNALITKACASLIALALVAWLGYSIVDSYEKKQNSGPVTADISALDDYIMSLDAEQAD